ncbi:MAG TPA: UvrD-helicase domain-containing protein [Solirubrobacteraceae bacterium]
MTTVAEPVAFDLCGELPGGVTVLEASAGTGKTYTIAGLAARYIAERGLRLNDLLAITFTRYATAELRDRVRERLVTAEAALERALAGAPPPAGDDRVLRVLTDGPPAELAVRRERLAAAVADFDAATIDTTHEFCKQVLGALGTAGDLDPDVTYVDETPDLVAEVVDDLYVRAFHGREDVPFTRAQALAIAKEAVRHPGAPLEPATAERGSAPDLRRRLAERVRAELERRKRRLGLMTYDDRLTRLDAALAGEAGEEIAAGLRARFRVVLVDEFQDTDPIQWSIVRRAFGGGETTLVLIGDPKQAIYAFRGADVHAYLDAARSPGAEQATLDVNWRSDGGLLDAYDALFGDAQLGHEGIVYRRVRARNAGARLTGAPGGAPLRIRVVRRAEVDPGRRFPLVQLVRERVAGDLAADVVELLESGARVEERPVAPGDVAVLVRRNVDAELVRDALAAAGVPAVLNGAGSVFETRAAGDWLRLLEAVERPTSATRAKTFALTAFLGWTAERAAAAGDAAWEAVHARLHRWGRVLRQRGVAALAETITLVERLPERVLAAPDGERRLTDLRHIGELLHAAAMEEQLGVTALTTWLRHRIAAAADELGMEQERSRRLESDAAAVQILTIHRSKGLEFPIVYLPFAWDPSPVSRNGQPIVFHAGDVRKVDVGLEGRDYHRHRERSIGEQRGEDLRLLYVALTRARHRAVVWWAGTDKSRYSSLGRLAFFQAPDGSVAESGGYVPDDERAFARFEEIAAAAEPGRVGIEWARARTAAPWPGPPRDADELEAATFDRSLDLRWRRTSYSDLTAAAHDPRVGSEPEQDGEVVADEPEVAAPPAGDDHPELLGVPSPLADLPAGVRVGTFVHDVLEAADFTVPEGLAAEVARARARRHVDVGDPAAVVAGLQAALATPLGPLLGGLRLRDVARADRLDELAFELPLAGGERASGEITLSAVAAALRVHLPAGDPLASYADRLEDPALRQSVRGYLVGSIDLVLRTPEGRFAVIDYKTNHLGAPGEPLTAWHYRPSALSAAMERSHYVLQGLLYTVALHRYLRWRLADYDPERHLAGILYLFLRGMTGADTGAGVFSWRPPASLVVALSDALDAGVPAA